MVTYLGLYVYLILIAILINLSPNKKINKKLYLIMAFLGMFVVMGFREIYVGTDTNSYCKLFLSISKKSFIQILSTADTSIVYILYNKILSLISINPRTIIVGNSFLICLLTVIFIYNNSKHPAYSMILFMSFYHYFNAMNVARQYIALLLVANAFIFLKNKNLKRYLVTCIIAILIHNTAIVSLILLPFFFIKPTKKNIFKLLLVVLICIVSVNSLMVLFSKIFPHYAMYFNNHYLKDVGKNRKVIITLIYIVFAFIMKKLMKNKINEDDREFHLLYFINYVAIFIGIVSLKIMLLSRIEAYFSIYAIIIIPKIFDLLKNKILYYFLFVIMMFIPMYIQMSGNLSGIIPYDNWLIPILS